MKNILLLFLLSFYGASFAQYPVLSTTSLANTDEIDLHTNTGNYAMDTANEREQYVGTWEYNQNGILLQVKIEKKDEHFVLSRDIPDYYFYIDILSLKYRMVKNGQEIFNNLNQTVFTGTDYISATYKIGGDGYLYGNFIDKTRNILGVVTIRKLNTTPEKITFEVPLEAYHLMNPEEYYDDGQPLFSIPTGEIEMVRVE